VQLLAFLAEEIRAFDDVALAVLHATTTSAVACGPCAELRHDAIDGTVLGVAFLGLCKHRAGGTSSGRLPGDCSRTGLETSAALFRAGSEVTPTGHCAADGASARVTFAVLVVKHTTGENAFSAAERRHVFHFAGPLLDTLFASDAAFAPRGPMGHAAVDGAFLSVASASLAQTWAGLAVKLGGGGDSAITRTETSVA